MLAAPFLAIEFVLFGYFLCSLRFGYGTTCNRDGYLPLGRRTATERLGEHLPSAARAALGQETADIAMGQRAGGLAVREGSASRGPQDRGLIGPCVCSAAASPDLPLGRRTAPDGRRAPGEQLRLTVAARRRDGRQTDRSRHEPARSGEGVGGRSNSDTTRLDPKRLTNEPKGLNQGRAPSTARIRTGIGLFEWAQGICGANSPTTSRGTCAAFAAVLGALRQPMGRICHPSWRTLYEGRLNPGTGAALRSRIVP